jgi:cell fate regulator YaaT (PSP1 superfamily)
MARSIKNKISSLCGLPLEVQKYEHSTIFGT